eukprot:1054410-Prorocentrum_minimum.AAC.3
MIKLPPSGEGVRGREGNVILPIMGVRGREGVQGGVRTGQEELPPVLLLMRVNVAVLYRLALFCQGELHRPLHNRLHEKLLRSRTRQRMRLGCGEEQCIA